MMNPSRAAIAAKIEGLDPARFQSLVEEYVSIQFPGRFKNLQRRGSNIRGETIAGWPDSYAITQDNRVDVLEITRSGAWSEHIQKDIQNSTNFTGQIGGFVFVTWARTPDPALRLNFQKQLLTLGLPSDRIALIFKEQLVSDLCQAKFALLWEKYLGLSAHCLPFYPIEKANIYGLAHQINIFTPTQEEYKKGLVHRPHLISEVEQHLRERRWALVRGKGASGKTVLAAQIGLGKEFGNGPVYYLDLASLVSSNEPNSSRALDVITSRKDSRVLFIIDNIHLQEQMGREIFDYWQADPAESNLLLLGRWTQTGSHPEGIALPLEEIAQETLKLEVSEADLLGVLNRLATRSGLIEQIGTPPAEAVQRWLALFGGDLIAFSAATALRIRQMSVGDWELTAESAKEYVRGTYLYPPDRPLSDDELHNLLLIAALSKLELTAPYEALRRGDIQISLRTGLVHRWEGDGNRTARFRLVHPGFGELLVSAADPALEENLLYQEIARRAPNLAIRIALRLEELGERDSAIALVHILAEDHRRLVAALLSEGIRSGGDLMHRVGVYSWEDLDQALCSDPDYLATTVVKATFFRLTEFLEFSRQKLPKINAGVVAAFCQPNNQAQLLETVLRTRLDLVMSFLRHASQSDELRPIYNAIIANLADSRSMRMRMNAVIELPVSNLTNFLGHAKSKVPELYPEIAAALAEPHNLDKLSERILTAPLGQLAFFLSHAKVSLPKVYTTLTTILAQPDHLAKLSEKALTSPVSQLTSFLDYAKSNLPEVYKDIAAVLAKPEHLATLSEKALTSPLGQLTSFLDYVKSNLPEIYKVIAATLAKPEHLATLSEKTLTSPLGQLTSFLDYAKSNLPEIYKVIAATLAKPEHLAALSEMVFTSLFGEITSFLNHVKSNLPQVYKAITAAFTEPNYLVKFLERALTSELGALASFLSHAKSNLPEFYKAIAAALVEPDRLAKLSERAFTSAVGEITSFLSYTNLNLPKIYMAIVAAFTESAHLAKLSEMVLTSALGQLVAFFRFSLSTPELEGVPAKILDRIDLSTWDRNHLTTSPDQVNSMHAAALLFQELGRPELMRAPAEAAILRPDELAWDVGIIGLHHLSQTLRFGRQVSQEAIQEFLSRVITESWLKKQYESSNTGTIATCLFSVWAHHCEQILNHFLTGALGRRLAKELSLLRNYRERELAGAISLFGCCSLVVSTLKVFPRWPTVQQVRETLNFAGPKPDLLQISSHQVQTWLGVRELIRLMPGEVQIPSELGESMLALWRKAEPAVERHLLLNKVMISWLDRCSRSGWRLLREQNSLFEELRRQAAGPPIGVTTT